MMAQKRFVLMFLIVVNSAIMLNCMEKNIEHRNSLIAVVPFLKRLFQEKYLEKYSFYHESEVILDLSNRLRLKPGFIDDCGTLKSFLGEKGLIDLIEDTKGLFTVRKSSPKSSSPIKNDQIDVINLIRVCTVRGNSPEKSSSIQNSIFESPKDVRNNQKKSGLKGKMSRSSGAILQDTEKEDEKKQKVFKDLAVESSSSISIAKSLFNKKSENNKYPVSDDEGRSSESIDDSKDGSSGDDLFDIDDLFGMES